MNAADLAMDATRLDLRAVGVDYGQKECTQTPLFAGEWIPVRSLGSGGMAEVFRVKRKDGGEEAALKCLKSELRGDLDIQNSLRREARIMERLRKGPNILRLHPRHPHEQGEFLLSQLVEGAGSLKAATDGRLSPRAVAEIGRKVAHSLHFAHEHQLLHRDVKPGNILLDKNGEPILIDWGMAFDLADPEADQHGATPGTPLYMSHDQAEGHADARSDVYSLGCSLYELLTGKSIVTVDSLTTYEGIMEWRQRNDGPNPCEVRKDVPFALGNLVARAMRRNPNDRFQSAKEMESALKNFGTSTRRPNRREIQSPEFEITLRA